VNVLIGFGANNAYSFQSIPSAFQVTPIIKDTILKVVPQNQLCEKSYRVQVCALRNKIEDINTLAKACGQSKLIVEEVDGYYKYVTISYSGYPEVLKTVQEVKSMPGFGGSFIVLYKNGKRIKPIFTTKNMQVPRLVMTSSTSPQPEKKPVKQNILSTPEPEKKQISKTIQHQVIDSAKTKINKALPSLPVVTDTKKNIVQAKTVYTNQYIPPKLLLFVLIFFALCFLLLVLFLIISHLLKIKKRRNALALNELYAEELAKYWSEPSDNAQVPELFKEANTDFRKDLLISEMITMLNTLSEVSGNKFRELYFKLQLDFYSFEKLQNRKWNIQAMGIHELAAFNAFNEVDSVEEFVNHPHPVLRHEAISAIVRLRPSDPFGFLDRRRVPFTKRDQLNAIAVLKKHHLQVPNFSRWFDAYDPNVVVFAVEMVCQFRQTEATDHFDKLLRHAYEEVRMSVIKAIGEMGLKEYSTRLIPVFNDEHEQIQLLILQAMGKLEDFSLLNFLSDLVLFNSSMKIRMEAAKALINIGPQGLTRMQTLLLKQDSDIRYIYHQIIG
jgi:HEAT repeat protein